MESVREGNMVVACLKKDSRVQQGILDIIEKHGIYSCVVICGIGMLKNTTLGFFENGKYLEKQYSKPMELLSMQGYVSSDATVHIHTVLGDRENSAFGGHLVAATVCNTLELTMMTLDSFSLVRKADPDTGLRLMAFRRNRERTENLPPL